jgi:prolipoprotein diacylglyceryl transferase
MGIPLPAFADALAPGLLVAQAVGRLGNWFNNELFGGATNLPWKLKIYEWSGGRAVLGADGKPVVLGYFHPTFLYELLWNLAAAVFVIWADRRFRLGHGRAFALYVASYCLGRLWVELLRTDPAEHFFGVRINVFTAIIVGLGAVAYFIAMRGRPREVIERGEPVEVPAAASVQPAVAADGGAADRDREHDHRPADPG